MYDNSGCGSSTTNVTTEQCHDFGLGWEPFLRSCYHVGTNAVTWSNAVKTCNSMGSVLTVITTAEENDFVIRLVKRKGVSSSEGYWLDGTDSLFEGLWIWSSTGILITYQNWGVNEPNNKDSTENCLELKTKKTIRGMMKNVISLKDNTYVKGHYKVIHVIQLKYIELFSIYLP